MRVNFGKNQYVDINESFIKSAKNKEAFVKAALPIFKGLLDDDKASESLGRIYDKVKPDQAVKKDK